jgi:hypothetical protein
VSSLTNFWISRNDLGHSHLLESKLPTVRGADLLVESQGPYSSQIITPGQSRNAPRSPTRTSTYTSHRYLSLTRAPSPTSSTSPRALFQTLGILDSSRLAGPPTSPKYWHSRGHFASHVATLPSSELNVEPLAYLSLCKAKQISYLARMSEQVSVC